MNEKRTDKAAILNLIAINILLQTFIFLFLMFLLSGSGGSGVGPTAALDINEREYQMNTIAT